MGKRYLNLKGLYGKWKYFRNKILAHFSTDKLLSPGASYLTSDYFLICQINYLKFCFILPNMGQVYLASVQIPHDLPDSLGLRHGVRLFSSQPSLTPSFSLGEFIFCKSSMLGLFTDEWEKGFQLATFPWGTCFRLQKCSRGKKLWQWCDLRSTVKVMSLNCKDLVCCDFSVKICIAKPEFIGILKMTYVL